jgi:hypothetical protein
LLLLRFYDTQKILAVSLWPKQLFLKHKAEGNAPRRSEDERQKTA